MTYITEEVFNKHLQAMRETPYLTVDTEGTLNHPFSETWGLSTTVLGPEYFAFNHMLGENLPRSWFPKLKETVENHPCLVMHHAKHDLRALRSMGINFTGKFYCTMLMSHLIDENVFSQSLDSVSRYYGGQPKEMPDLAKQIIKSHGWKYIPVELMRSYAGHDAFITDELFYAMIDNFQSQGFDGELWDWEQKMVRLLGKIEDNGALIDQNLAEQELERGLGIMKTLEKDLGFNPNSPKQLGNFLLDELKLPPVGKKSAAGNWSFDKDNMEVYDELLMRTNDSRARKILTYRGWMKTTSSNYKPYLELLSPDGRIRCNYKMHGTKTGRCSCEKPNLQQIPRSSSNDWNGKLKEVFITEQDRTPWEADYSQLEFRLGAAYAQEQKLIAIFADPTRDVFSEMALELGMIRQDCKTLNYTLQFGGGAPRLSEVFGTSMKASNAIKDNYFTKYPGLATITALAQSKAEKNGFVKYWTDRRRHFRYPASEGRKAFNSVCQGGAFEIVKRSMIRIDEAGLNNDECRMDLQVHDSIRFDIENGKEHIYLPEIRRIMEDVKPDFGVKFRTDTHRWATEEKYEFAA